MIITTKHTASGRLIVSIDGMRASIDKIADFAIRQYRLRPFELIELVNEQGVTISYTKHMHACLDTYSVYYDAQELKAAIRQHAERR